MSNLDLKEGKEVEMVTKRKTKRKRERKSEMRMRQRIISNSTRVCVHMSHQSGHIGNQIDLWWKWKSNRTANQCSRLEHSGCWKEMYLCQLMVQPVFIFQLTSWVLGYMQVCKQREGERETKRAKNSQTKWPKQDKCCPMGELRANEGSKNRQMMQKGYKRRYLSSLMFSNWPITTPGLIN